MLTLHERTRRKLCRAGFLLLCVGPSLAIAGWISLARSGLHARSYATSISRDLRLAVSMDAVTNPLPRSTLLRGVVIKSEDQLHGLVRSRLIEIQRTADDLAIQVYQPHVTFAGARAIWSLAERQLRGSKSPHATVRVVGDVTLGLPTAEITLTDVQAKVTSGVTTPTAMLQFRVAGSTHEQPVALRLQVSAADAGHTEQSTIQINSGNTAIPAEFLALLWPALHALGRNAMFTGAISASCVDGNWTGQLQGVLENLELNELVTERFPHKLSGTATVHVADARFEQGRLISARGVLTAGPGLVSASLLNSAAALLGCGGNAEPRSGADPLPYQTLAVRFELNERGFSLRALADAHGGLMADSSLLLREPAVEYQPVVNVIRALVPRSDVLVPATRQTEALVSLLPIPAIKTADDGPSAPRLRVSQRPR